MEALQNLKYGFVGLGLMGGSLAKAIRAKVLQGNGAGQIFALDVNKASLQTALDETIIDKAFAPEESAAMLRECDFVFICLYPKMTIDFLAHHRDEFKSGAIVTDIAGVKTDIIKNMDSFLRDDVEYICAHPMAGSEKEGIQNAHSNLFENRNYILMPHRANKKENIAVFKELVYAIGFSRITETDYQCHDHKIAFTSQLCHVIAAALVDSAEDTQITAFGGGSFEDLTRIAMINAPLWTELFLENRTELLSHLDNFEKSLNVIKQFIQNSSDTELQAILQSVREKRIAMQSRRPSHNHDAQ